MLELSTPEPHTSEAVAGWYTGTVCRLSAGVAPGPGGLKKSQRWVPHQAGQAWRLCRRAAAHAEPVYFHGGNAQPLTLTEAEAITLAAALNRRPEAWLSLAPGRRY
jgi:hypothetical protein